MEKIWLKQYAMQGVKDDIDLKRYSSIMSILSESIDSYPNHPAFSCMGSSLTFKKTDELSMHVAAFFQETLKLEQGSRVALMMPNVLAYPVALLGILRSGLIAVNVNPLYTPRELEHQLNDSGAETIFILENFAHVLAEVLPKVHVKNIILVSLGDLMGFKGNIVNFVVKYIKKMIPSYHIQQKTYRFNEVLSLGARGHYSYVDVLQEDIAFLQYTGGTTGIAKGAMLTHKNIIANILQVRELIHHQIHLGQEVIVTALPLYHIFSLTANMMCFMSFGAHNILITNPKDLDTFINTMKKYKVTAFTGVNTLFNALINHPKFKTIDFSSWRLSLGGGMAVQKAVAEQWKKITGLPLVEAYGLTETSPAACINPLSQTEFNGMIGIPIPMTEVDIRDHLGQSLPLHESGELFIRGPQVMKGYWNRPEETRKVLGDDGFLATGDMAIMNDEGFIRLVDRKKDMILVSGFNVYPNEIEEVVMEHPKVKECACVGVSDEKSGEVVKLFIVKKDESLTKEEILVFCKEQLTGYKVPKIIVFREQLPKTNVGKILRRELREEKA
jgi:long-chain acyl-CoA synthetase